MRTRVGKEGKKRPGAKLTFQRTLPTESWRQGSAREAESMAAARARVVVARARALAASGGIRVDQGGVKGGGFNP